MIPTPVWRCPLCETNDALVHISRRLRADLVRCTHCSVEWRVRRVLGDDYYLKLLRGIEEAVENSPDARSRGSSRVAPSSHPHPPAEASTPTGP